LHIVLASHRGEETPSQKDMMIMQKQMITDFKKGNSNLKKDDLFQLDDAIGYPH
jgi:hypothetical protein